MVPGNAHRFDRILYQLGNSPFHKHMFELLQQFPGVVTLHEFFLGNVLAWMEGVQFRQGAFRQALYEFTRVSRIDGVGTRGCGTDMRQVSV